MRDPLALELVALCQDLGISPAELLAILADPAQPGSVPRPGGSAEAPRHHPARHAASYTEATPNEALTTPEQYCSTPLPESDEDCSTVQKTIARTTPRRDITPAANPTPFCTATNHLGEPCKARALRHTNLCYHHHPDTALEANVHSRRAGSTPRRPAQAATLPELDLFTRTGIVDAAEKVTHLAIAGKLPTRTVNQVIRAITIASNLAPLLPHERPAQRRAFRG